jgi:hypothetical protein
MARQSESNRGEEVVSVPFKLIGPVPRAHVDRVGVTKL